MAVTQTPNYNLTKPGPEEFYDVNVFNENADKIDAELAKRVEKVENKDLSKNDYTDEDKSKVGNLPANTNQELSDKVGTATFQQHTGDLVLHVTAEERQKWNNAANADLSSYLPKSGGTMTGALTAQNNSNYSVAQVRNIIIQSTEPTSIPAGVIVGVYE